jgi:CubicO group peptidase (beta-lactamase class C family)|tara:strand:+ start:32 stop:1333 length:1302 start_codon:yes stop_codon:yes gene_type:complete
MMIKTFLLAMSILASAYVTGADLTTTKPERVGMSTDRLTRIGTLMQAYVDQEAIAGSVTLIARKGKIVHFEPTGVLNLDTGEPMQNDSLFRIYSMTKPITSVAAMLLFEQGKFQLDDPIAQYLPEFSNVKVLVDGNLVNPDHAPTIRELLSHTAGLTYGIFSNTEVDKLYREALWGDRAMLDLTKYRGDGMERRVKDLDELSKTIASIPLLYQPGSQWVYSISVDILGRLIEVISGQSLDQFLQQEIFDPLEMEDTFFEIPKDKIARFGTNHIVDKDGNLIVVDRPESSDYSKPVSLFSGGGGLVSSTMDYLRFAQMLLNGGELNGVQLLSPTTVALMQRNQLTDTSSRGFSDRPNTAGTVGFGLGIGIATSEQKLSATEVGAYSWGGMAGTLFWVDPEHELVAILMVQRIYSPEAIRSKFRNLTYQAITEMN